MLTQDFFLLCAICNTVIVAKYPHRDAMNASGKSLSFICVDLMRTILICLLLQFDRKAVIPKSSDFYTSTN